MDCPSCATPLVVIEREGIELDWCTACGGVWFDGGELAWLADRCGRRLALPPLDAEATRPPRADRCPRCRSFMTRSALGAGAAVFPDRCPEHGLWFTRPQLAQLLAGLPLGEASAGVEIGHFLAAMFGAPTAE